MDEPSVSGDQSTSNESNVTVPENMEDEKNQNNVNSNKRSLDDDLEPVLVNIEHGNSSHGKDIHIHGDELSIGRARDNDETIANVLISRYHCRLQRNDHGDWMVTNLSSTHTFLNKTMLPRGSTHKISIGDTLQLSESSEFKYLFTMAVKCSSISKRVRMGCNSIDNQIETLQGIVERQKQDFAVLQASEKSDLEKQLNLEKEKQEDLRQQLEQLLSQQKADQGENLREQIASLQEKIELGNGAEQELKDKYSQLLANSEKEKQEFEEKLAEEKRKWEEALESTKREKETLEASLKSQMEEWKVREATEWKNKMDSAVQEEISVREKLSSEKLELVEKMKQMEAAIREQQAKAIAMQAELRNKSKLVILDTIDLTQGAPSSSSYKNNKDAVKGVYNQVNDIMEEQLTCSICSELFVTAMTLNCTHTFCRFCIMAWIEKKKDCPNCRSKILSLTRSLVIDNFIEKMVESFSLEHKKRRVQLLKERAVQKTQVKVKMAVAKRR